MKQSKKFLVMLVATMLMATSVWASEVTIIKKLNGTVNESVGTVTQEVSEASGQCTVTVTPANGYYIETVTAEKTVDGGVAQGRLKVNMDNFIAVAASDALADPSNVTSWTFTMPGDDYNVEVVANFQTRTDISDATVTLAETSFNYDGDAKEPAVSSVVLDDIEIVATNYTVNYSNNKDAGTATVSVTGKGTYMGTATATFTINKAAIEPTVSLEGWTYGEQPEVITPTVGGNLGGGTVTYTYKAAGSEEFTNAVPQDAGTHTIKATIAESANYLTGEATNTFIISKADLELGILIEGWTYGDTPVDPEVTGNLGNGAVTITYQGENDEVPTTTVPTNAGGYNVFASVAETANYNSGNTQTEFSIEQADFSEVEIAAIADQTYTGDPIEPTITVTFNGNVVDASEYDVDYGENNVDVGTVTITVTSNGINFSEDSEPVTTTFEIVPATVVITAEDQTETYNGDAQEFTNYEADDIEVVVLYYATETGRENGEDELEVAQNAGTYYVKLVSGDSNYTFDPVYATFTIDPKSLDSEDVSLWTDGAGDMIYNNGLPLIWEAGTYGLRDVINEDEVDLEEGEDKDFTVSYSNNTNVGTATVTFTGIGNYQGTLTEEFDILRQLDIHFSENNVWASYYAEENLEIPEGLQAYIVTEIGQTEVEVEQIDYIPQHVGVLLTWEEPVYAEQEEYLAYAYEGTTREFDDNLLMGCSTATAVSTLDTDSKNIYILYNDNFVKTTSGTIPAFRCYLEVEDESGAQARLGITIDDSEINGISENVVMNSGKFANSIYDLNGRRMESSTLKKGMYILNGKKVVVK